MPTIRQLAEFQEVSTDNNVAGPVIPAGVDKPMRVARPARVAEPAKVAEPVRIVTPGMSAIEYIVETARPGEVIHVDEGDYYNKQLWRSYNGLSTRYSRT